MDEVVAHWTRSGQESRHVADAFCKRIYLFVKLFLFDSNFFHLCPVWSHWQWGRICIDDVLNLTRRQCFNANNDDPVHFGIYPSNLQYKRYRIPRFKCLSSRLSVVFAQSAEARCEVENEDVVGAALTCDTPTTSEWSIISLLTNVRLILQVWLCKSPYLNELCDFLSNC